MASESEAIDFLEHDFDQCFQQMRHYDSQILDILKFMATVYSILTAVGIGIYENRIQKGDDYSLPICICLGILFCFGVFAYMLTIRNRIYFVHVARYVNEIRGYFLTSITNGFKNLSRMYVNHQQPPFFNWRSSQSFFIYLIAFCNSSLLGVILYISTFRHIQSWSMIILPSVFVLLFHIVGGVLYLKSRHGLSASKSVFGED